MAKEVAKPLEVAIRGREWADESELRNPRMGEGFRSRRRERERGLG